MAIYAEARDSFEVLGEPGTVAGSWHQIGMVHRRAGQFEAAERASQQALGIRVQHNLRSNEADSLTELGNLYDAWGRPEEAVTFYRQAADIEVELQNLFSEGRDRGNLARTLLKLSCHDEARPELQRAIECFKPFGHAAEPWRAYGLLYDLEQATGNPQAAAQARQQAVEAYLAYRRDGGKARTSVPNSASWSYRPFNSRKLLKPSNIWPKF